MYEEILGTLNLSPNEAKIYEALLDHGESSVSEISVAAKIHRRNAYDAISRLTDKGLCFQIASVKDNRYRAVDPDKLKELLSEKTEKLENILPILKKKFQAKLSGEESYIYRGLEGQKNIWRDVLREGRDSHFIGGKGGWFDPRLQASRVTFFKGASRKKITFIQLFDYEVKNQQPFYPGLFTAKLRYRFLPKEYSTSSGIHIFGDYVVTYTGLTMGKVDEHMVFFVIRSRHLAEDYRTWFQYMWQQSSPH